MEEHNRLTETVNCGGCAGKLNALDLYKSLSVLPLINDSRIVSGFKKSEDASVMKLSDDIAIVFSTDFIAPILDDPYDYGRAAAAHALSDIYALGAIPIMALNIVCFQEDLGKDVLEGILLGGNEICEKA
jgi:selenide,water dikinase